MKKVESKEMAATTAKLEMLAKPLCELLRNQYDPHSTIVITQNEVKIVRDELGIPIKNRSV